MIARRANIKGAEASAKLVLRELRIDAPEEMPVDPIAVAERLGLIVQFYEPSRYPDLDPSTDGFLWRSQRTINVRAGQSETRQRFTIAHEIGHFIMHQDERSDFHMRDGRSASGSDPKEMEANRFGAALLMPEDLFRMLAATRHVADIAAYFNVSQSAVSIRLRSLYG